MTHTWYVAPSGGLTLVNKRTADDLDLPKDHPLCFGVGVGAQRDAHIPFLHPDDASLRTISNPIMRFVSDSSRARTKNRQRNVRTKYLRRRLDLRAPCFDIRQSSRPSRLIGKCGERGVRIANIGQGAGVLFVSPEMSGAYDADQLRGPRRITGHSQMAAPSNGSAS